MDNNLFYETDIKIRFDNSNHKNEFLGVAGDSETRKLNFSVFDSEGTPVLTDFPVLKLLVKGEYDGTVYYSIAEKKQRNEYSVVVPSQIFKQKQTVKMQFVIEDKARKKKIYTSIIEQKVAEGLCSNAVEGTNIYIDYDEILKFEENFDDFLNSISQDKEEILLEMSRVKDENKAEILLIKGGFEEATKQAIEEASKQAVDAANKAKEEAIAVADTVKEKIETASEQATVEIKKELGVIKIETVEEMNSIKRSTIANVTEKGNQINASLTENKELILTAIAEKETSTINKITEKENEILLSLQTKIDSTKAEITELANTEIENFKGLAAEEISKAVADLKIQIEESKSGILGEISDLVATSKDEISQLKTTSIAEIDAALEKVMASIKSKETDSLTAIDNATQEAIESITNEAGEAVIPPQMLENIKNKADKVHKHEISDVNTLTEKLDTFATNTSVDDKLSEIELKDTAIDVVSEEKKLNVVLEELRAEDIEQSADILNLKNELNGYVERHVIANDSIQKSIND